MGDSRPNVLLIHCHDLGRYLGCYGEDIETPAIDALAADGAVFDRHFVTAPQCSPSRGSLLTGRYPHVNGLMGLAHGSWELGTDERIMPQYLQEAGYETHLFGLQHVTQDTDRLEYDHVHSEGNLYPGVTPAVHQANRARNVASVVSTFLEKGAYDGPFFASVGFFELHRVEEENGRFGFDAGHYDTDDPDEVRPLPYLPDRRGIRLDLAEMHGMVYALDDAVGTICESLEQAGIADETVVIFTTEHGIAFPRAKGSVYDAGIEAALIVRYPGVADGGRHYDELLSNVDVLPTVLELVGLEVPDAVNGRSFLGLLDDERGGRADGSAGEDGSAGGGDEDGYRPHEHLFAEMTWHDMYDPVRAVRTERYKFIKNFWHLPEVYFTKDIFASEAGREVREDWATPPRAYEELYDLHEDPQEQDNVVREPRYEDVVADLSETLREWMEATDDPLLEGPLPPGDYEEITSWPTDTT
ncbi:sulfatase family protein [Natronobiforma cellulositropha]|uniref:sulfatase family protein n=1 Tax=Natronobiforma cellulositropha TaxID=1679076 RepID=UPI0021D5AC86|nr:sulfatase [Natronobiforma cellulositropha]